MATTTTIMTMIAVNIEELGDLFVVLVDGMVLDGPGDELELLGVLVGEFELTGIGVYVGAPVSNGA